MPGALDFWNGVARAQGTCEFRSSSPVTFLNQFAHPSKQRETVPLLLTLTLSASLCKVNVVIEAKSHVHTCVCVRCPPDF